METSADLSLLGARQVRLEQSWREAEAEAREAKRLAAEKEAEADSLRDGWAKADADAKAKTDRMRELRCGAKYPLAACKSRCPTTMRIRSAVNDLG